MMEFTEKSHQGYCPWIDNTGFPIKDFTEEVHKPVSIPKRMKRLIDGDLASLRDSGQLSTRDRLKEKLKRRQDDKFKYTQESAVNEDKEVIEEKSDKRKRRRKRNKRANESVHNVSSILCDEQKIEAFEKENCIRCYDANAEEKCHAADDEINTEEIKAVEVRLEKMIGPNEDVKENSKVTHRSRNEIVPCKHDSLVNIKTSTPEAIVDSLKDIKSNKIIQYQEFTIDASLQRRRSLRQFLIMLYDFIRKLLEKKEQIQICLPKNMHKILKMRIENTGFMLVLEARMFNNYTHGERAFIGSKSNATADFNIVKTLEEENENDVRYGEILIESLDEARSEGTSIKNKNDSCVYSHLSKDSADDPYLGYCPWIDDSGRPVKDTSDQACHEVPLSKKIKKLIDGDLASIRTDGKMSTRDRLKDKFKKRQEEKIEKAQELKIFTAKEVIVKSSEKEKMPNQLTKQPYERPKVVSNVHEKHHSEDEEKKNVDITTMDVQLEKTIEVNKNFDKSSKVTNEVNKGSIVYVCGTEKKGEKIKHMNEVNHNEVIPCSGNSSAKRKERKKRNKNVKVPKGHSSYIANDTQNIDVKEREKCIQRYETAHYEEEFHRVDAEKQCQGILLSEGKFKKSDEGSENEEDKGIVIDCFNTVRVVKNVKHTDIGCCNELAHVLAVKNSSVRDAAAYSLQNFKSDKIFKSREFTLNARVMQKRATGHCFLMIYDYVRKTLKIKVSIEIYLLDKMQRVLKMKTENNRNQLKTEVRLLSYKNLSHFGMTFDESKRCEKAAFMIKAEFEVEIENLRKEDKIKSGEDQDKDLEESHTVYDSVKDYKHLSFSSNQSTYSTIDMYESHLPNCSLTTFKGLSVKNNGDVARKNVLKGKLKEKSNWPTSSLINEVVITISRKSDNGTESCMTTNRLQFSFLNYKGNKIRISIELRFIDNKICLLLKFEIHEPQLYFNRTGVLISDVSTRVNDTCLHLNAGPLVLRINADLETIKDVQKLVIRDTVHLEVVLKNMFKSAEKDSYKKYNLKNDFEVMTALIKLSKLNIIALSVKPMESEKTKIILKRKISKQQYLLDLNGGVKAVELAAADFSQRLSKPKKLSVKAFLLKLNADFLKRNGLEKNKYFLPKKVKIGNTKSSCKGSIVKDFYRINVDRNVGRKFKEPTGRQEIGKDEVEQNNAEIAVRVEEEQEIDCNSEAKVIEIVEQSNYGIRLCMYN